MHLVFFYTKLVTIHGHLNIQYDETNIWTPGYRMLQTTEVPCSSRLTEKDGVALRLVTCQEHPLTITTLVTGIFVGFALSVCEGSGKYLHVYHSRRIYTIQVLFVTYCDRAWKICNFY
jgi:hypothetical protein